MEEQTKKEALKQKLQEEVSKWQIHLDELRLHVKLGSMEASEKIKEEQRKIEKELAQAKVDLKQFDKATEEAWATISDGLKTSLETIKESFSEAKKYYK